ncbi:type I-F CRISPR-associated endoribonuclease Cas6/Csy4 [Avibacterium sp. 20-15]|uniref:type I-F CRISPR-associated endoribonuclease Cas6/Csy4 n=1 Tax=unclassified Avibacterium TaxID=2685287 RepID=UPI0020265377|nr:MULTISPECIES: type I-F CRISPR-associated endoribonuclease Cas6/Csy4 [unclassified Avibacterium]MCW9733051.1 type I-F CRISPR-associated endoribonuclease Cas6/Csy4 [Avibacterium sp. 20-15]URL05179.1 type I-F CRISPR-associated endoribonuclease Cas6/Csy4 [Avibacterium sp. 20-132]
MTKFYQEITLIDNEDYSIRVLWEKLYQQLHIAFADLYNQHKTNPTGVSFPHYQYEQRNNKHFATLGNKIRLIAPDEATLSTLNVEKWLARLTDYIHIKKPAAVPDYAVPVMVKRYRFRPIDQQAKAHAKRHQISYEEALTHCKTHRRAELHPPFIRMKSESNAQSYPLVILQTRADNSVKGGYSTYGLSHKSSTVPSW